MQISQKAIDKIKNDNAAIGALMGAFDKHFRTIENWINNKDIRLTTPKAVEVIGKYTGLSYNDIVTKEEATV